MDWDVYGHEWAAFMLAQHIARQEVRHAYLFCGPPGVGRRTLALRFARALQCTQPPQPGGSCGTCRTCTQIDRMQQSDLAVVQAQKGGTLKVDQVRELLHTLALAPYESKYRLALLLRFEDANASAQNALLKTLEEPASRVVLLLTAESPEALLPTISSRCEVLRLRPVPVKDLENALQSRWSMPADEAHLLAHVSGGCVGQAVRMHADHTLLEKRAQWLDDLLRLVGETRRGRFAYAEKVTDMRSLNSEERETARQDLRVMLQTWLSFWRDCMLTAAGASAPLTHVDYAAQATALGESLGAAAARARVADLEQVLARLDANVNPRLLLEVLLLDWPGTATG